MNLVPRWVHIALKNWPKAARDPGRLLLAILTMWLASAALAPAQAQGGKRIAFVIGNAKYEGESTLANPHNDAALLAGVFKNDLRFDEVVQHRDLNRKQMYDLVREVARKSRGADSVVVYYSGHGMRGGGGNYLIPTDARIADEDDVRRDALAASELVDALQASNARVALLILDACRDSPYSKRTKSGAKGLARMGVTSGNLLVAYATTEGSTADDGRGGNSPYAQALAEHLRNTSQPLLTQFDGVRRSVRAATGNKQNPTREGDLETGVYLASVVPERVAEEPRRPVQQAGPSAGEIEQQAWDAARSANSETAYRAYLAEYPQGRYAGAARVNLAALRPQPVPEPVRPSPSPSPSPSPAPAQARQAGSVFKDCADCPEMVVIPSGTFTMGSNDGEPKEKPPHSVTLKSFAMGKYEVTWGQYAAFLAASGHKPGNSCYLLTGDKWVDTNDRNWRNPGFSQTDNDPVTCVNWDDAQAYVRWLSQKTGQTYRLPSEAEWEYACRGGANQTYCGSDNVDGVAVYGRKYGDKTQPVGGKQANAWGLYDMGGNVWEWVQDCWNVTYSGAPSDGKAWTSGECGDRVVRGGSWDFNATRTRAAYRNRDNSTDRSNNGGFRLARIVP